MITFFFSTCYTTANGRTNIILVSVTDIANTTDINRELEVKADPFKIIRDTKPARKDKKSLNSNGKAKLRGQGSVPRKRPAENTASSEMEQRPASHPRLKATGRVGKFPRLWLSTALMTAAVNLLLSTAIGMPARVVANVDFTVESLRSAITDSVVIDTVGLGVDAVLIIQAIQPLEEYLDQVENVHKIGDLLDAVKSIRDSITLGIVA